MSISKLIFISIIAIVLCFETCGVQALSTNKKAKKQKSQTEIDKFGEKKLKQIQAIEAKSYNGIIEFTTEQYLNLVQQNPRPYDVVILWNIHPSSETCEHCSMSEIEFNQMVYSFHQARGKANKDLQQKEKPVFFGVLYFIKEKQRQKLFKDYQLLTVPYLTVSEMDLKRQVNPATFFKSENKWLIGGEEVHDAQKQIDFVNNSLRTDVQISYTFFDIMMKNLFGILFICVFYQMIKQIYDYLLKQWVWFFIAITVFVVCTGGLVYSMINNTPFFKYARDENGGIYIAEYFMRGQRGQWKGEGWLVSTLVTLTGLMWLYIINLDYLLREDKSLQRIVIYISLFSIFIMQKLLVAAYRKKSPWYNPGFMPPDYYGSGSLMQDQGNNI